MQDKEPNIADFLGLNNSPAPINQESEQELPQELPIEGLFTQESFERYGYLFESEPKGEAHE